MFLITVLPTVTKGNKILVLVSEFSDILNDI